jgi:amidophosphoribosyltransferase
MATLGATVDMNCQVVSEINGTLKAAVNGDANGYSRREREREESGTPPIRDRHDIRYIHSIHI